MGALLVAGYPPHPSSSPVVVCGRRVRALSSSASVFEANRKGHGGKASTRESLLLSVGHLTCEGLAVIVWWGPCQSLVIPCFCHHHPLLSLHMNGRQGRWATLSVPHVEASSSLSSGGGIIVVIVVCPPPCVVQ